MPLKQTIVVFLFFIRVAACAQFIDQFADGDFTANPAWSGDDTKFAVVSNQLKLQAPAVADATYLSTASTAINDATWEFWVKLDFNPSGSNLAKVYVVSDNSNLHGPLNGYFVMIGDTDDEVSLYRQTGTVSTKIIDGVDDRLDLSAVVVKIKVTRDAVGNWQLLSDVNATGAYQLEGAALENTHVASMYFGVSCVYTSTRSDKFYFDDFSVSGDPFVDTVPPTVTDVTPTSATELTVVLNEEVQGSAADDVENYEVNFGIGQPSTATLAGDGKTVILVFDQPFQNGKTHELTLEGIEDLNGNAMTATTIDFLFFQPVPPTPRDLIFSEVFPDPSPGVDLPDAEYVEFYNRSAHPFDLDGWTLTDGSSTATLSAQIIQPGEYWVVTDENNVDEFDPGINIIGASNFPTLNNAGDTVVLRSPDLVTIDSVSYGLDWYHNEDKQEGGWSIELINPLDDCNGVDNWTSSIDPSGGTPGFENSVFSDLPDTKGPQLVSAVPLTSTLVELTFSEKLDESTPTTLSVEATPVMSVVSVAFTDVSFSSIQITLSQPLTKQVLYTLSVSGVADCPGNAISDSYNDATFYFLQDISVVYKDVIITEIMADPDPVISLPATEYLEILNRTDKPIDLLGWGLEDETGTVTLPPAVVLPGSYWILTADASKALFSPNLSVLGISNFPTLNNDGESLVLKSPQGSTIDSVKFSLSWYRDSDKEQGGWSLEIIDTENPCGEEDNWSASEHPDGGTPGIINSINANKPDLTGPELLSLILVDLHTITLVFNEKLDRDSPDQMLVKTDPVIEVLDIVASPDLRQFTISLAEDLQTRQAYVLTVDNTFDCSGNPIQEESNQLQFAVPEVPVEGDLIINEVLFNPRPNGVDFVELWNLSKKFIQLQTVLVTDEDTGTAVGVPASDTSYLLAPGALVVITSDADRLANEYPGGNLNVFVETDLPAMPDDGGFMRIINADGETIDALSYSEDFHSPLVREPEGISLEKIHPEGGNSRENWKSATAAAGYATPGLQNSNFTPYDNLPQGEVKVEPEVFSPGTGFRNFALVHYQFDQPGLVTNVKIFDRQGRLIKTLANNEVIAANGFFRWDGDLDDGSRARSGYYFVWFEVFSTDGFIKTFRHRVVIAFP